jgi:hypothetical protein
MRRHFYSLAAMFVCVVPAWAEDWEPAKTHAVIVGVLEWKNGLGGYSKIHRKDQELRDVLVQRGVPSGHIEMLLDREATLPKIRSAVAKTLKRAESGSTLIVYYCGHGWAAGDDFCFANYEVKPSAKETAWSLRELAGTLTSEFKGRQVFLWADCCFSGGLEIVVDALAAKKVGAFSLTSASQANTSTNNWTFTQSIIDGLRGEPLVDANGDGKITLGELAAEVKDAMRFREGQLHGYSCKGIGEDLVLARASGPRPKSSDPKLQPGVYVDTPSGAPGRLVAIEGDRGTVQFYDYSDKRAVGYKISDLKLSTREPGKALPVIDAGVKPDCQVEWQGNWYPARVVKKEKNRWYIHYIGYDNCWDEWVGVDRIKFTPK